MSSGCSALCGSEPISLPGGPTGSRCESALDVPEQVPALPAAVEVATYRIATEALTNVVRHSRATDAAVLRLRCGERLEICRSPTTACRNGAWAARGRADAMRERAAELGGSFQAGPTPDRRPGLGRRFRWCVMSDIRVVLADDHPVVRAGLAALLGSLPGIEVVGVAADGREAVREVVLQRPNVAVLDLQMPGQDGFAATREIARVAPEVAVLGADDVRRRRLGVRRDASRVLAATWSRGPSRTRSAGRSGPSRPARRSSDRESRSGCCASSRLRRRRPIRFPS